MRSQRPMRFSYAHLWCAVAVAVLLGGCGANGSSRPGAAPASSPGDRGMIAFTDCMRAHGVAMRDPYHRPGHAGLTLDLPEQTPAIHQAWTACASHIQSIIELKAAHARQVPALARLDLTHYAECMRTHGIPMLDPNQDDVLELGNVPGIAPVGRYTSQFHAADHVCRRLLPSGVADNGSGP